MAFFGKKKTRQDINLIPEEQKEGHESVRPIRLLVFIIVLVFALGLIYAFATLQQFLANSERDKIESQTQEQVALWQKEASKAASVKTIKEKLATYQALSQTKFETKLRQLAANVPAKVEISSFNLSDSGGTSQIEGKAVSGSVLYQFVQQLKEKTDEFSEVRLTSVTQDTSGKDLNFTISAVVN